MSWTAIIAALLQFFGPKLLEWLKDIFAKAETKLAATKLLASDPPAVAIHDVFKAARAETYIWQFTRRAVLNACERVALKRADELAAAALNKGLLPVMTGAEFDEVTAAIAA